MRTSLMQALKKIDDVLEVLVFDWALHPQRRVKTLAVTALAGALAMHSYQAPPTLTPEEAFEAGTELLAKKARAPEAVRLLEQASQGMKDDARVWQNLGHAYLSADRPGDAVVAYTRAANQDASVSHLFFLGYAQIKNDLPEVALGYYDQILEKNAFFYPALAYQGVAHDKAGRYDEALRHFRRALAYNPSYLPAYFHMGITFVNTKEYERSIEAFQKVIALDPSEAAAYYNIACCYSLMGDVDQANEWLRRAVEKGFHDYEHMDGDSDLDAIRASAAYKELREQARQAWVAEATAE